MADLASPIVWRPLLDERVQSFLAIFGGRYQSKALGGVLDRTAEIGIGRAHEGIAADLHDAGGFGRQAPAYLASAIKCRTLWHDLAEQSHSGAATMPP
jgi:hypothetical protein